MLTIKLVLMVLGAVCLFLAAFQVQAPRISLQSLGLLLWLSALIIA